MDEQRQQLDDIALYGFPLPRIKLGAPAEIAPWRYWLAVVLGLLFACSGVALLGGAG
jgi:hypothetical protein